MHASAAPVRSIGRYALYGELAAGGMATVHFGRLLGPVGFARTVAIKRLHPQFAKDPEFVSMFLDEARLAARIQHPNVVSTLDVVAAQGELFLVLEYVAGESLARLARRAWSSGRGIPPAIATAILSGALHGLHAAHEAKDERGAPLGLVHRDVSPQNILVGRDGAPRVLDFGVAKAAGRFHTTKDSNIKGKLPYMSPEQLRGKPLDRTTDVYAAAVVLWETLTGERLFKRDDQPAILDAVLHDPVLPPSSFVPEIPEAIDALVMRGLDRDASRRFQTAREFALALERAMPPALASDVGEWVDAVGGEILVHRAETIAELESSSSEVSNVEDMMATLRHDVAPPNEASQVTNLVASSPTLQPAVTVDRRRGLVAGLIGIIAALVVVSVVLFFSGTRATSAPATPPPAAVETVAVAAASVAYPSPPPTARVDEPAPPVVSAPVVVMPKAPPAPAKPRPLAPAKPEAASCNPPFKIGPDGEKVYKRECIQ